MESLGRNRLMERHIAQKRSYLMIFMRVLVALRDRYREAYIMLT